MLKLGDTFLLPTVKNPTEHLWVVITERNPKTHEAVCVNITKIKKWTTRADMTLELSPGIHEFVTLPSVVYYKDARIMLLNLVEQMLVAQKEKVVCVQLGPCSAELLVLIRSKMAISSAKNIIKEKCRLEWEAKGLLPPATHS
jgi:hypothetical protein